MEVRYSAQVGDARSLSSIGDESVQLIVTSPPYPMVAMWDEVFGAASPEVGPALQAEDGMAAFEAMHRVLDGAWAECVRVLSPGGTLCVNVGDAVRTVRQFQLYPNHARILQALVRLGLTPLPDILWRKPNNSPNKFLGSGMLPAGAYVTYEHEYILVFRKGEPRAFRTEAERALRRRSAFFWEERNTWFSDLWTDVQGTRQALVSVGVRERSGAFPMEIPHRLIQMYSCLGDTVLDPFMGTGTTPLAAVASGRSGLGVDRDREMVEIARAGVRHVVALGREIAAGRLEAHRAFVRNRATGGRALGHHNVGLDVPVNTRQEADLEIWEPEDVVEQDVGEAQVRLRAAVAPPTLFWGAPRA